MSFVMVPIGQCLLHLHCVFADRGLANCNTIISAGHLTCSTQRPIVRVHDVVIVFALLPMHRDTNQQSCPPVDGSYDYLHLTVSSWR